MTVGEMLQPGVVSCHLETPVKEVAVLMKDRNVGAVLVLDSTKPVGIVTDRDLVIRVLASRRDFLTTTAEEVMTGSLETIDEHSTLTETIRKMSRSSVRRLPVLSESGEVLGLLSFDDLFMYIAEELGTLKELTRYRDPKLNENAA